MARTRVRRRLLVCFVSLVGATAYLLGGRAGAGPIKPPPRRVYVVQPGDTVWSIARRSSGPTADPRPLVDALVQANGLEQSVVVPGERLVIPAVGRQASGG